MTTTTTPATPADSRVLWWAGRSLRWGSRKLATGRDVLLWAAGFTNPAPFPGTGMLGDAIPDHRHPPAPTGHYDQPAAATKATGGKPDTTTTTTKRRVDRRQPARTGTGRAVSGLQQRLAAAITAGPPDGGTWTGRALAAHLGCSRSTAWAALNAHKQCVTTTRTRNATGTKQRGRRAIGRTDRER